MAAEFKSRVYIVYRQDMAAAQTFFYSPMNSVFEGKKYLSTNLDFASAISVGSKADEIYKRFGVKAVVVGPFGSLLSGGGVHCLTRQYRFSK